MAPVVPAVPVGPVGPVIRLRFTLHELYVPNPIKAVIVAVIAPVPEL
jgi:hypothetical protein